MTSFAITYTVRNEGAWILDAIVANRAAGCSRFYIFLDGTTDQTRALLAGIVDVCVMETELPDTPATLPGWLRDILPRFNETMDVRKRYNTWRAAGLAQAEGIDWLASIDVDEVLYFGERNGSVVEALNRVPLVTDQVLMRNLELVPTVANDDRPFSREQIFLRRFRGTERIWRFARGVLYRCRASPRLIAWAEHVLYRLRLRGKGLRALTSPITGEVIPAGYYLGYCSYKSLVRSAAAHRFAFDVHRWKHFEHRPRTREIGYILHYDLPNASAFLNKFRQRSQLSHIPAFHVRFQLAQIAIQCPPEVAARFFDEQVRISQSAIDGWLRQGVAFRVASVARSFDASL
jgi:hypothetical protein